MRQDFGKSQRKIPSWLLPALGYTLSATSLIWVFHGFNLQQTLADLESLDWRFVSVAVIFDLSVYLAHGWRWNILLRPVARPSFWRSVQAIYIGLYANEVLPLRTGEVIRCYLLAHWNKHSDFAGALLRRDRENPGRHLAGASRVDHHPAGSFARIPGRRHKVLGVGLAFLMVLLFSLRYTSRRRMPWFRRAVGRAGYGT